MTEFTEGTDATIGSEASDSPDVASVEQRDPARRTVSRFVGIAACAVLVAALGGFFIGRTAGRSSHSSAAIVASDKDTSGAPTASTPTGNAESRGTLGPSAAVPNVGDAKMSGLSVGGGGGQYGPGAYPEPAQPLIAERTTPSGITIRAHRQDYGAESSTPYLGQFSGWTPAGWCFPTGQLRVSVVTPTAANLSGAPWYNEPKNGVAVSTFAVGYVEGSPAFGAVVQVGADITSVTFATASGLSDTTTPTKGLALLAVPGPIEESFSVTLTKADGTKTTQTSADLIGSIAADDYHTSCEPPPPALPTAGAQPSDPVAAEAAVRESWKIAHDFGGTDPAARLGYLDDPTGIEDALVALNTGQFADVAKGSTSTIKDFVFSSPTEAWFRYDIVTSITNFNDRYGQAHLGDDGVWRITRQTVCQDLALAPGTQCSPPVANLLPPSAATDPRYQGGPTQIFVPNSIDTPVSVGAPAPPQP